MQKKIYCTKCGREIQPGLLYCDRCGQSVKKSIEKQTTKKDKQLEEIHQDRLNRKKVQRAKEIKKAVHRKKAAKANRIVAIVAALLIIALISAVAAYISVLKSSTIIGTSTEETASATAAPTEKSNVTVTTTETEENEKEKAEATPEPTAAAVSLKTYTDSATGLACQYPSGFAEGMAQDGEKARLTDIEGGAVIIIGGETVSDTAPNMMLAYIDTLGASTSDISMNRAGNDWYTVTAKTSSGITHRKFVMKDGNALYYDFTYDTSSLKAQEYEEYISQMDAGFNP